jgi:hypothetical protein
MILGFNVGGFSWAASELRLDGVTDDQQLRELVEDAGYMDARCASAVGGQYLRVFTNGQELANSPRFQSLPFQRAGSQPLMKLSLDEKLEHLDELDRCLDRLLGDLTPREDGAARKLDFDLIDAYLAGVAHLNRSHGAPPVKILLSFVEIPPRWILDAPSATTCRQAARNYSFQSLWHKWTLIYIRIVRDAVRHAVEASGAFGQELLGAVEIVNEPDYEWLPDEYRIEKALAPAVNPLNKYVTELHLNQIPDQETSRCIQETPWGGLAIQDGGWGNETVPGYPLVEFPWGPKLDWYVKAFADLHTHLSWAVRDELRQARYSARIVSCSVTHNNALYFAQMYRSNPETFAYVDAIGVHPYHFPNHNIWDDQFRSSGPYPNWLETTPRAYARECFKRFDFIEEIGRLTAESDPSRSFGLAGKKIWITEFGIPTKGMGKFNSKQPDYASLIRRRRDAAVEGHGCAVWEDLWDSFFRQVQPDYLAGLGVEAFFFYALRETTVPGFDKHDDDRSNFGLLTREGQPRMDPATADALRGFIAGATGAAPDRTNDSVARIARALGHGCERLDSEQIHKTTTMLSSAEKRLLYFLARDYYSGQGAILDAGCFLGGSTMALAQGLLDRGDRRQALIHAFDLFQADPFMIEYYLPGGEYLPGDSFLPLYEKSIDSVRQLVQVHAGDLRQVSWTEGPIEIFFIDIAKSWETNDHLVTEFFPHLIPGRSIVVQQDYVHEWCPWLHVAMERLAEYFEPLGFVEHNTMVYRLDRPIPRELTAARVSTYSREDKIRLMHRSVNRFHGAERGFVECAEAVLLSELGEADKALRNLHVLENRFAQNPALSKTIRAVMGMAQSCLGRAAS